MKDILFVVYVEKPSSTVQGALLRIIDTPSQSEIKTKHKQ